VVDSANLIRLGIPEETLNNLKNFTLKGVTITDGTEYVVINFKYGRFVVVASSLIKPKTP
jgi:hypothetical protein